MLKHTNSMHKTLPNGTIFYTYWLMDFFVDCSKYKSQTVAMEDPKIKFKQSAYLIEISKSLLKMLNFPRMMPLNKSKS